MGTDRNSSDEIWIEILSKGTRRNSTEPIGSDVPSLTWAIISAKFRRIIFKLNQRSSQITALLGVVH